jgi:hypothetical protein
MKNDKKSRSTCLLGGDTNNDCADCIYGADYHYVDGECVERDHNTGVKKLAKELCDKSPCHHKCQDTTDCIVEEDAELLINQNKSNNFEVKSNNLDVKSNEELFKQALVEGLNRHFDKQRRY